MPNIKTLVEVFKAFLNPFTTKFPASIPDHLPNGFKGKIQINKDSCVGCGACFQSCPSFAYKEIYEGNIKHLFYNPESCIFCEQCVQICPTESLSVSKIYDMSLVANDNSLEELINHELQQCNNCEKYFATIKQLDWIHKKLEEKQYSDENRKRIILDEYIIARYYCEECRKIKSDELVLHDKKLY